jgi:hypothetical protein
MYDWKNVTPVCIILKGMILTMFATIQPRTFLSSRLPSKNVST